jgi:hypothetical protein
MGLGSVTLPRRLRIAAVVLIVAWFFLPGLQAWIPLWIPFLAYAALELNFLILGLREPHIPTTRGRIPQTSDIDEFGGEGWLEPRLVRVEGQDVWIPAGGKSEEEIEELIEESRERLLQGEPAHSLFSQPPAPAVPPRRRLLARLEGVAVFGALAFVLFVLVPDRGWDGLDKADQATTEAMLSFEAARIAGHAAADVHCDARGEAVGVVQHADGIAEVGGRNAYLTPDICYRLYRLKYKGDEGAFSQTARAIAVLAHEAWHLHGETDEGITNCYAFQSGVALGRRLGLSEGTAARMMRQQLADNAIYAASAPEYLVPRECRDGGSLDLAPDNDRFP